MPFRWVEVRGWFRNPSGTEYDLAIYGAGPAGHDRRPRDREGAIAVAFVHRHLGAN